MTQRGGREGGGGNGVSVHMLLMDSVGRYFVITIVLFGLANLLSVLFYFFVPMT